jgi:ADP-dependent NAD(P)H-hydrate dehydratase
MECVEKIPMLPDRPGDGHKGLFGKVLIIAGSTGMSGAAALAGRAALRCGAGLVRIACPQGITPIIASLEPAYTTIPLAQDDQGRISARALDVILGQVEENDVIALGPGLGMSNDLRQIIETLIGIPDKPLVIDADGLNNLARIKHWLAKKRADIVLTPHPGEMKRLWQNLFREPLPQARQEQAHQWCALTHTTLILKGAGSVIMTPEKYYINTTGNPGMATGGSGDVLTGIVAALRGQGLTTFETAVLGSYIHGLAGDMAARRMGQVSLIASDIIDALPTAFQMLNNDTPQ